MKQTEAIKPGRALERAVTFIQETILKHDPKLKVSDFVIEPDKIVTIAKVRHEIDVYVKTLPNSPYEAISIFECKHWNKPVGKNEIIILSEKVKAASANRGFLVAKEITKHAQAQLDLDNRLRFIKFTEDFFSPLNSASLLYLCTDEISTAISFHERGIIREKPHRLKYEDVKCQLNDESVSFSNFARKHVRDMVREDQETNKTRYRHESNHFCSVGTHIDFNPNEFTINNADVESMDIESRYWLSVRRQKIISKFEFKTQGRVFMFEPIADIDGKKIEIKLVELI